MRDNPVQLRPHHVQLLAIRSRGFYHNSTSDDWRMFEGHHDEMHPFLTTLHERRDTPIVIVDSADTLCRRCVNYDKKNDQCGGYHLRDDKTIHPEELRRRLDQEVAENYDLSKVRNIGDVLAIIYEQPSD